MLVPLSQKAEASETVSPVVRSLSGRAFIKEVGLSMRSIVPENALSFAQAQIIANLRGIVACFCGAVPLAWRTYPSQPTRGLGFPVKL